MANEISAVLEFGVPEPGEMATMMEDKLRFHTDSWDLSVDLKADFADIVVIDARSRDAYIVGNIPGGQLPTLRNERGNRRTPRPQQGLCHLLRRDRLQCIDQGRLQARAARISRQRIARRTRLVAPRRASGDRFAGAGPFACSRRIARSWTTISHIYSAQEKAAVSLGFGLTRRTRRLTNECWQR